MNLRRRTTCRVCGSPALREVINLGDQFLQGSFVKEGVPNPPMRKIPCSLVRCCPEDDENACGLLQMRHSVPPEILYSTYWYRSGTNATMRAHLAGIVQEALDMHGNKEAGSALDIGCNDCTLMSFYSDDWKVSGIDPSDTPRPEGFTVVKDIFPSSQIEGKFDIITSIAMFYDLEDPIEFGWEIESKLAEDGLWIVEMSYMPSMLELNSYDTICHEHLEYYSLAVIERIASESMLKVVRAELNSSNGGSIRCYISHQRSTKYDQPKWSDSVRKLRSREFDLKLDTDEPYRSFQSRIDAHRLELVEVLNYHRRRDRRIHLYGASTKGNTILQWCGIDAQMIEAAADRNPEKHGAFTLGTGIPIISEEKSREMKPDIYLVLPWHFADEMVKREEAFLEQGGMMIFPLPKVRMIQRF